MIAECTYASAGIASASPAVTMAPAEYYISGRQGRLLLGQTNFAFLKTVIVFGIRVTARPGERMKYCLADVLRAKEMLEKGEYPQQTA
jgi:hypothetical protein